MWYSTLPLLQLTDQIYKSYATQKKKGQTKEAGCQNEIRALAFKRVQELFVVVVVVFVSILQRWKMGETGRADKWRIHVEMRYFSSNKVIKTLSQIKMEEAN